MKRLKFSKMHGLGNDFMVINAIDMIFDLTTEQIKSLSDRRTGIGFDQLLLIEGSKDDGIDFNYRIFNADGAEVEHCGNGARCFAKFVEDKKLSVKKRLRIKIKKGIISTTYHNDDNITVDMGRPTLNHAQIPFNYKNNAYQKQYQLHLGKDKLLASVLSMGNPHVVFFVDNLWQLNITNLAQKVQKSDYFPKSANINFVERINASNIKLRTYERGVGETNTCGTGACASAFVMNEMDGLAYSTISVETRGGKLTIVINNDKNISMSGAARHVFDGEVIL